MVTLHGNDLHFLDITFDGLVLPTRSSVGTLPVFIPCPVRASCGSFGLIKLPEPTTSWALDRCRSVPGKGLVNAFPCKVHKAIGLLDPVLKVWPESWEASDCSAGSKWLGRIGAPRDRYITATAECIALWGPHDGIRRPDLRPYTLLELRARYVLALV